MSNKNLQPNSVMCIVEFSREEQPPPIDAKENIMAINTRQMIGHLAESYGMEFDEGWDIIVHTSVVPNKSLLATWNVIVLRNGKRITASRNLSVNNPYGILNKFRIRSAFRKAIRIA
jgi:hypothetical protein